jgi:hypothetical protein
VSFQTASKVLNGGNVRVSAQTAARIIAVAKRLGYRPNTVARSAHRPAQLPCGPGREPGGSGCPATRYCCRSRIVRASCGDPGTGRTPGHQRLETR